MFSILFAIGIITAIAQILSSFADIKNPDPSVKGFRKITGPGWFFYACTTILAVLPGIQNEMQEDIDKRKAESAAIAQEERDRNLRKSYDSSLRAMKAEYDTTEHIIAETLGKYGFKLDSTNKVLINIKDSVRNIAGSDPVLRLVRLNSEGEEGIVFEGNPSPDLYKFRINIISASAGSAYLNVTYSFVLSDSVDLYYVPALSMKLLPNNSKFSKDEGSMSYTVLRSNVKLARLYLWVHGSYKRLDGTGNFLADDVYVYYFSTKQVRHVAGNTRNKVTQLVNGGREATITL